MFGPVTSNKDSSFVIIVSFGMNYFAYACILVETEGCLISFTSNIGLPVRNWGLHIGPVYDDATNAKAQ